MTPQRIHWHRFMRVSLPAGAVPVTRPSRWGNPYRMVKAGHGVLELWAGDTRIWCGTDPGWVRREAVARYETDLHECLTGVYSPGNQLRGRWPDPAVLRAALATLAGKDLACACKPGELCHGDVLLAAANLTTTNGA